VGVYDSTGGGQLRNPPTISGKKSKTASASRKRGKAINTSSVKRANKKGK